MNEGTKLKESADLAAINWPENQLLTVSLRFAVHTVEQSNDQT